MNRDVRQRALEEIRENVARFGYHLYIVNGEQVPRYAYTIGLSPKFGYELLFAGGIVFMHNEIGEIVKRIVNQFEENRPSVETSCAVGPFGSFSFRTCDPSWTSILTLGAMDFYQRSDIPALQIVPDDEHSTIDVPNASAPWGHQSAPVWKWLQEPWKYAVPHTSHAVTDLEALRGSPVTEACRWAVDYWELFAGAGPDVPDEEKRVVGIGTLIAADPTLVPILDLQIGSGIWREGYSDWHVWKSSKKTAEPHNS